MTPATTIYYKDSLTNTIVNNDSAIYNIVRTQENGSQTNGTFQYYITHLAALNVSTSIFCTSKTIGLGNRPSSGDLYETSPIFITSDSIINRQFTFNSMFYDPNSCIGIPLYDIGGGYHYNTYYGLTSYGFGTLAKSRSYTIEGSIINGLEIGNVWSVGIDKQAIKNVFSIYPNPSTGENFTLSGENIRFIAIHNSQGQLIKKNEVVENETSINVKNQPRGVYFVKSIFKDGSVKNQKIITY